ncbi:MAG: DUF1570 domain-containing protein [Planctomycetes bacterium]|nr:DUF1570 domain-containing protein [Planctomycetota bacterium]
MKKMVNCPQCDAQYDVTKLGDKKLKVQCPKCKSRFIINPLEDAQENQAQTSILQTIDRPVEAPDSPADDTRVAESKGEFYKGIAGTDQDDQETPENPEEAPDVKEQPPQETDAEAESSAEEMGAEEYAEPASEETEKMPYSRAEAMRLDLGQAPSARPSLSHFFGRKKYSFSKVQADEMAIDRGEFFQPSKLGKAVWMLILVFVILTSGLVLAYHFYFYKYFPEANDSAASPGVSGAGQAEPSEPEKAPESVPPEPVKETPPVSPEPVKQTPKEEQPKDENSSVPHAPANPNDAPPPPTPPPFRGESSVAMPAPRRVEPPPQPDAWLTKETEHFSVSSDCPQDALDDVCVRLENIYKTYAETFKYDSPVVKKRTVKIFKSKEAYQASVQNAYSGGFYNERTDELSTFMRSDMVETLYHECAHMFFDIMIASYETGGMPSWINEGMASYFGAVEVPLEGDAVTGKVNADFLNTVKQAINGNTCADLKLFFFFPRERFMNPADPDGTKRMYAQAWSICYFLMKTDNENYKNIISKYIDEMKAGKGWFEAHQAAFEGVDLPALENDWKKFVLEMKE